MVRHTCDRATGSGDGRGRAACMGVSGGVSGGAWGGVARCEGHARRATPRRCARGLLPSLLPGSGSHACPGCMPQPTRAWPRSQVWRQLRLACQMMSAPVAFRTPSGSANRLGHGVCAARQPGEAAHSHALARLPAGCLRRRSREAHVQTCTCTCGRSAGGATTARWLPQRAPPHAPTQVPTNGKPGPGAQPRHTLCGMVHGTSGREAHFGQV